MVLLYNDGKKKIDVKSSGSGGLKELSCLPFSKLVLKTE
jgi:hypothetical protein